jgi:protein-S-isoprenylcysteine O-methyltransferase Ste14
MRVVSAAAGSAIFFGLAPGVVAGLIPWWFTGWHPHPLGEFGVPIRVVGSILIVTGTAVLLHAFGRFVREGLGTPAPLVPTEHLVVSGLYRHVRNPMYLAVVATIVGQAFALGRFGLLWYAATVFVVVALFVHGYEEPTLSRQFGDEYARYREEVRRWLPSW